MQRYSFLGDRINDDRFKKVEWLKEDTRTKERTQKWTKERKVRMSNKGEMSSNQKYKRFYLLSLLVVLFASAYPIYMGFEALNSFLQYGVISSTDYPKYIIPYTPMCLAIVLVTIIFPALYKYFKNYSLLVGSVVGIILFLIGEVCFEQIQVEAYTMSMPVDSWQLGLCMATPEVLESIGEPIFADQNPTYKVHFYLIAISIIVSVIGLLYGFTKQIKEEDDSRKVPLIAQTICVILFIGLCILACITAFFRNGTLYISPLSAFLTGLFFVVFGMNLGVYISCLLYGKKKWLSVFVPAIIAILTTYAMYVGELYLMDGYLFIFGEGKFFEPLGNIPFSCCDLLIILFTGVFTGGFAYWLNRRKVK